MRRLPFASSRLRARHSSPSSVVALARLDLRSSSRVLIYSQRDKDRRLRPDEKIAGRRASLVAAPDKAWAHYPARFLICPPLSSGGNGRVGPKPGVSLSSSAHPGIARLRTRADESPQKGRPWKLASQSASICEICGQTSSLTPECLIRYSAFSYLSDFISHRTDSGGRKGSGFRVQWRRRPAA